MIKKEVTIKIPSGLEARPIAKLVQLAGQFDSEITVMCGNKKVNAKSIMGMMTMGIDTGETITVCADGPDEEAAVSEIEKYLTAR